MQIDRKKVSKDVVQITTSDERWYYVKEENTYYPSLTWILSHLPKGYGFIEWLKKNGENSDTIRDEAAAKGSKVHNAIELLKDGKEIKHDSVFYNDNTKRDEELTADEYESIYKWAEWVRDNGVKFLLNETTLYSKKYGFACTLDDVFIIGDQIYINDCKTSKAVQDSHAIQASAIKRALFESIAMKRIKLDVPADQLEKAKLSVLLINKTVNKKGIRHTVVDDDFEGFLIAKQLWEREVTKKEPLQRELPISIKL